MSGRVASALRRLRLRRRLAAREEEAWTLLRIAAGLLFAFHGLQKVFGVLADHVPPVGSQLWFGGVLELLTGAAMALGLATAWAGFLASGQMAVAYVQFHWRLELGPKLLPALNHGELALVYSLLFLHLACRGGGRWSLDRVRSRRAARRGDRRTASSRTPGDDGRDG